MHLPQNGTIGFDPRPLRWFRSYIPLFGPLQPVRQVFRGFMPEATVPYPGQSLVNSEGRSRAPGLAVPKTACPGMEIRATPGVLVVQFQIF